MNTNINTSNKPFQKYVDLRQKCVDHIQRPTIHLYQCCTIESVVDAPLEPSIAEKSLLNEIRQAEDELAIVITETELANEKNQAETQALETQYSQITASLDTLHKSQNTIREKLTGLHSIRDGLSEQQASTQML